MKYGLDLIQLTIQRGFPRAKSVNSHCIQFPVVNRKSFLLKGRDRIVCQISEREANISKHSKHTKVFWLAWQV